MFCSTCGTECVSTAKFCHKCGFRTKPKGEEQENTTKDGSTSSVHVDGTSSGGRDRGGCDDSSKTAGAVTVTFDQFKKRKEEDRRSYFGKRGKKVNLQADLDSSDVKIDIGVIVLKDGILLMKRGSTLPVTVPQTIGSDDLLEKAVEKHSRYNTDVIRSTDKAFYRLLYPDKSVVHTLPGSNQPFTLQRYKNDIGKPYSKLTLFLWTSADYHDSLYHDFGSSSNNDELSDATPVFVPLQKKPKSSQIVQHQRQSYLS